MTVEELQIIISMKVDQALQKTGKLKSELSSLTPQKTPDVDVSTGGAQKSLKRLQSDIDRTVAKINNLAQKKNILQSQINSQAGMFSDVPNAWGMGHEETVKTVMSNDPKIQSLTKQMNALDEQLSPLNAHLAETKAKIASLGSATEPAVQKTQALGREVRQTGNNFRTAGGHAGYFGRMVKSMLISMILYRGLSFVTKSISEGFQDMAQGSSVANATLSQLATSFLYLKNSIASAFMPVVQAVTPALVNMANQVGGFLEFLGMLNARLFGNATTFTKAKVASVNYAQTLDGVSKKAKEAQKSLASFDQLNVLQNKDNSADTTKPTKPGMPSFGSMFEQVPIPKWVNTAANKIKEVATYVTAFLSGALLAVGAFLVFSGANIPLGLGLMILGAAGLAADAALNWSSMQNSLTLTLTLITLAVSGALLALGAMLALSGTNVPLGIGLMIAGCVGLAAAVAMNWGSIDTQIQTTILTIMGIVGGALLVLGAILIFTGAALPLGLGLMIAGAAMLAAAIAVNWNSMSTELRATLTDITAMAGVFLLAMGLAITLTGANLPLGIGLMVVGAANLAAAAAINWNTVGAQIRSVLAGILAIASVASVAIGLLLCLTGAGLPLGIGLIMAGMSGVRAASSISTNPVVQWARGLMNGVIGVFESGINWIISMLDRVSFTVPDWVMGIGGQHFGIDITPVHIPRLATGGVVKGATPLIAGENGAEAIMPLENNTGWISELAKQLQQDGGTGGGEINLTIPIYLDRNGTLLDIITKHIDRQARAGG